jgi:hypothetical protein
MHPGLESVQPVYSGFGNYIVGEWPTIGHKWLLSVVFVLMDGAPHGHIPDALSRCMKSDANDCISSPDESDPYFPYVAEQTGIIDIIAVMFLIKNITYPFRASVYCEIK